MLFTTLMFKSLAEDTREKILGFTNNCSFVCRDALFIHEAIGWVCNVVSNVIKFSISLEPLDLLGRSKVMEWLKKVKELEKCVSEWQRDASTHDYKRLLKMCGEYYSSGMLIKEVTNGPGREYLSRLDVWASKLNMSLVNTMAVPVGFILTGPPGCGKTYELNHMAKVVASVACPESASNQVFNYSVGANFQDSMPSSNPVSIVLNDVFSTREEHLPVVYVDLLQALTDSVPFTVNRAALADKANSTIYHHAVFATANTESYTCSKSTCTEKLNRRYTVVNVEYTQYAIDYALRERIPINELFSQSSRCRDLDLEACVVIYVGKPNCSGSMISWATNRADRSTLKFNGWFEFQQWFAGDYPRVREFAISAMQNSRDKKYCIKMLPLPHPPNAVCDCMKEGDVGITSIVSEGAYSDHVSVLYMRFLALCSYSLLVDPKYTFLRFILALLSYLTSSYLYEGVLILSVFMYVVQNDICEGLAGEFEFRSVVSVILWVIPYGMFMYISPIGFMVLMYMISDNKSMMMNLHYMCNYVQHFIITNYIDKYPFFFAMCGISVTKYDRLIPRGRDLAQALLVAMGLAVAYMTMRKLYTAVTNEAPQVMNEGNVVGSPTNIPDVRKPVVPIRRFRPDGLGPRVSNVATISCGKITTKGTVINSYVMLVNTHLFKKADFGDIISGQLNGRAFSFKYEKGMFVKLGSRSEAGLLYTKNCLWNVGNSTRFVDGPIPSIIYVNGHPVNGHLLTLGEETLYRYTPRILEEGDCGTPFYDENGVCYGIHRGRSIDYEYGLMAPVYKSDVEKAMKEFNFCDIGVPPLVSNEFAISGTIVDEGVHPKSDANWLLPSPLAVVGYEKGKSTVRMSGKPSEMYPVFGSMCKRYIRPNAGHAKLAEDGVYYSLAANKIRDMGRLGDVDLGLMEEVFADMEFTPQGAFPVGEISWHQTFVGDCDNAFMNPRDDTKAIGPYLRSCGYTSKNAVLINSSDGTYTVCDELVEELSIRQEIVSKGEYYRTHLEAVPKDTLETEDRVALGKGRLFFVTDLANNLHLKKCGQNVFSVILADVEVHDCYASINAGSPQWKRLYNHLTFDGEELFVMEFDVRGLDSSHSKITYAVHGYYKRQAQILGYTETELEEFVLTLHSARHYLIKIEGNYYMTDSTVGSGQSDTIQFNSISLKFIIRYALAKFIRRNPNGGFSKSDIRKSIVGDDSLVGARKRLRDAGFNALFIKECALELGYVVTSADKTRELTEFVHISEATFLKRRFVVDGDRVFAPLALESLYKAHAYVIGKTEERIRTMSVLISMQSEFFLHGREALAAYHEKISEVEKLLGISVKRRSYDELLSAYDANNLVCW
jgi:hypothetical protein